MKRLRFYYFIIVILSFPVSYISCKKNTVKDAVLPLETTTGAMTFGCKVNGKVILPKDGKGKPGLFVQYENLGTGPGGGWFLNIPSSDYQSSSAESINITTDSLLLKQGEVYQFKHAKGFAQAFYAENVSGSFVTYESSDLDSSRLYISKFDQIARVLSGTFSFIGIRKSTGQKVFVTDGRFDIRY